MKQENFRLDGYTHRNDRQRILSMNLCGANGFAALMLGVTALLLPGCTQPYVPLTPEGEVVKVIPDPSGKQDCSEVDEVRSVALAGELNSYRQAMNMTLHRLAEQGATHLSIRYAETRPIATTIQAQGWYCREIKTIEEPTSVIKDSWIIVE